MTTSAKIYCSIIDSCFSKAEIFALDIFFAEQNVSNRNMFPLLEIVIRKNDHAIIEINYLQKDSLLQQYAEWAKQGRVRYFTGQETPLASILPFSKCYILPDKLFSLKTKFKISRFAYISTEDGRTFIRSPRAFAAFEIYNEQVLRAYYRLGAGCHLHEYVTAFHDHERIEAIGLLWFLINANIVLESNEEDITEEDTNLTLMQWEFHDMLMHTQSRIGSTSGKLGGTYRFKGVIEPQSVIKRKSKVILHSFVLPRPNSLPAMFVNNDFSSIVETRSSIRNHGIYPMSLLQLSAFLFQTCRVKSISMQADGVELVNNLFPGGGSSNELSFYLTISKCDGLPPGFYLYDSLLHTLELLSLPCAETDQILQDAATASYTTHVPQIVISFASRFQRVSWKYQGIAYAIQLKNVGVVFQHMYLVATAMGLAPCALGAGNSEILSKLAGTNYFEESSIGEFMLGTKG